MKKIVRVMACILAVMMVLGMYIPTTYAAETNVAIGKSARFLKDDGTVIAGAWGNNASNAVDGDNGTVGQAAFNGPYNTEINLGGIYTVSSVNVLWGDANYATAYDIKTSMDGVNWTTAATVTGNVGNWTFVNSPFAAADCRYVMMDVLTAVGGGDYGDEGYGYGVAEIQINGTEVGADANILAGKSARFVDNSGNEISAAWGNVAANAFDGNSGTPAQTADPILHNLEISLGGVYNVTNFNIGWDNANTATAYLLKVSMDGENWTTVKSETNAAGGWISSDIIPVNCRFLRIDAQAVIGSTGFVIWEMTASGVKVAEDTTIDSNKTARFLHDDGQEITSCWGAAGLAIDGDPGTYAQVAFNGPHNFEVNLGGLCSVEGLKVKWDTSNYAATYTIKTSLDGISWTTAKTVSVSGGGQKNSFFTAENCRYVMIDVLTEVGGGIDWGYGLCEVEIIGTQLAVEAPITAAMSGYFVRDDGSYLRQAYSNYVSNLFDGNPGTSAQISENAPYNTIINLGGVQSISGIEINWDNTNYAASYTIKTSMDAQSWTTAVTVTGNTGGWKSSFFTPTAARYVMIDALTVAGGGLDYGYGIWGVSFLGTTVERHDNLAPGKFIKMVKDNGQYEPDAYDKVSTYAIDGDLATACQGATAGEPYNLVVDLAKTAKITGIAIENFWAGYVVSCDIKVSDDETTWTTVAANLAPPVDGRLDIPFTVPAYGRFVMLDVTAYQAGSQGGVPEFEIMGKFEEQTPEETPVYGYNQDGGRVFQNGDVQRAAWGIDLECFKSLEGDLAYIKTQIDAAVYTNCTTVAIPVCWGNIEPQRGNYTFDDVDDYYDYAVSKGLTVIMLWVGTNYASGNNSFIPQYIHNNMALYGRVDGPGVDTDWAIFCPNDPDTRTREMYAYYQTVSHIKKYDTGKNVLAVVTTGEFNYMSALDEEHWQLDKPGELEKQARCACEVCDELYTGGDTVEFMTAQFANFAKDMVHFGATVYDLPTMSQFCPWSYFPDWRYAENPEVFKQVVDRENYIVVPSVSSTATLTTLADDLARFSPANIPGNIVFDQGVPIDTATRLEAVPWISLMQMGGMGGTYWDPGTLSEAGSIREQNVVAREKMRKYFGPLKALEYQIVRLKDSQTKKFWWKYGDTSMSGATSNFAYQMACAGGQEYGSAFELAPDDVVFAGSTYNSSFTLTVTKTGGFSGYVFERGYFDPVTGVWNKTANFTPTVNGNDAAILVNADSGVYTNAAYRIYKKIEITGVQNGSVYYDSVTPAFNGGTATLNGAPFVSGTAIQKTGDYTLTVSDGEGSPVTVAFSVVVYGDVNGDGLQTVQDLVLVKKHLTLSKPLTNAYLLAANMDRDAGAVIDALDLVALRKYLLGI